MGYGTLLDVPRCPIKSYVPEYGFFNSRLFTVIDAIVLQVFCEVLPTCGMCHLCLMCVNVVVCMKLCSAVG